MTVKDLVNFRKKKDKGKKAFVEKIKSNKVEPPSKAGGNYWASSFSAVCRSYKDLDISIVDGKIDDLQKKLRVQNGLVPKICTREI